MARTGDPVSRNGGFTLLEVVVALAVIAIAMGALVKAGSQQARTLDHLRGATVAQWVAENHLVEMQLTDPWPSPGEDDGKAEMVGQPWYWTTTVEETSDPAVRRVTVAVWLDPDREGKGQARLTGFLPKPAGGGP